MRILLAATAVAAIAACAEPASEPAVEEIASATPTATADTGVTPGTYEASDANGVVGTTTINADGTYVETDADGKERRGTYVRRNGQDCFTAEGEAEMCWSVGETGRDGSFIVTSADGATLTIAPRVAPAETGADPATTG